MYDKKHTICVLDFPYLIGIEYSHRISQILYIQTQPSIKYHNKHISIRNIPKFPVLNPTILPNYFPKIPFDIPRWHHLSLGGRLDVGVAFLTDDIVDVVQPVGGDAGERLGTVVGKVTVRAPGATKIRRALNEHGRRPERLQQERCVFDSSLWLFVQIRMRNCTNASPTLHVSFINTAGFFKQFLFGG